MSKRPNEAPTATSVDGLLFDNKRYYTVAQTAKIWGVCRTTIYNYMGKYPAILRKSIRRGNSFYLSGGALNNVYYGKPLKR